MRALGRNHQTIFGETAARCRGMIRQRFTGCRSCRSGSTRAGTSNGSFEPRELRLCEERREERGVTVNGLGDGPHRVVELRPVEVAFK